MSFELESIRSAMKDTAYKRVIEEIRDNLKAEQNLKQIANMCIEKLVDATQSVGGTFWYYDINAQNITAYAVYGGKDLSNIVLKPNEGVAGKVIYTGKSVLIDSVKKNQAWSNKTDTKTGFATESMICIPVKIKDVIIGCVQLVNHRFNFDFEQKDLDFAEKLILLASKEIEENQVVLNLVMEKIKEVKVGTFDNTFIQMFRMLRKENIDLALNEFKNNPLYNKMSPIEKIKFNKHLRGLSKIVNNK